MPRAITTVNVGTVRAPAAEQGILRLSIPTPWPVGPVNVYLIWHQRTNAHPAHRWFRNFILEQYDRFSGSGNRPAPTVVASRMR